MDAYALAIAISLVAYICIGNWAGRKVKHLDDYFVAGRRAPTFLVVGTLVASVIGTNSFLGDAGFAYSGYALAMIIQVPLSIMGYIFGSLFFGRFIRRARTLTVAEFFGRRFDSKRVRTLAAVTVIMGLGGYLMTVTQGSALIISQVTEFSYPSALVAVWLGYSLFTIYAGSRGVVITDTAMFLLFSIVGIAALAFIAEAAGGWFESIAQLANFEPRPGIIGAEGFVGDGGYWSSSLDMWIWAIIIGLAWSVVFAIGPWQSSRYLMARDENVVVRSACVTTCILSLLWTVIYISGPMIALSNPDVEPMANAMIWAALNIMPTLAGALLLAGIVSAGLSSASTFLTLVGFSISNDVLDASAVDDARRLRASRLTILVIGIITLVIALMIPPSIFWITNFVGPIFAASWGPIAFMSVWNTRVTEAGAFWGMAAGFVGCALPKALVVAGYLSLPAYFDPILIGAAISLATILLVSRNGSISDAERHFLSEIHTPPADRADAGKNRATALWPKLMTGWGIVLVGLLIVFYVRPYQLATGQVGESGPYVVMSGELVFALSFGVLISGGGLFTSWAIKRFNA
jgi:sodium/pantothenate symporter